MSVTIRPYRKGGWEVDIRIVTPDAARRARERKRAPMSSRSAALRWGEAAEREMFARMMNPAATPDPRKEVPTLSAFAPRFMNGHSQANRQKPSGIASKQMILRVHLLPALGHKRLDTIKTEDVQHLKGGLVAKSPKTVNNVPAVLSVMLKKAVEWEVIERMPCTVKLLPVPRGSTKFHDFDEFEKLVETARLLDPRTHLIVLPGGDAGLRCGEMMALEWSDVDLANRQLTISRSDWSGHVTTPKGGRSRQVPLTGRLAAALSEHRHLRSKRVLCQDDAGRSRARSCRRERSAPQIVRSCARRRARSPSHLLLTPGYSSAPVRAIQELAGHSDLAMTQRCMHLSPAAIDNAIRLLDRRSLEQIVEIFWGRENRGLRGSKSPPFALRPDNRRLFREFAGLPTVAERSERLATSA